MASTTLLALRHPTTAGLNIHVIRSLTLSYTRSYGLTSRALHGGLIGVSQCEWVRWRDQTRRLSRSGLSGITYTYHSELVSKDLSQYVNTEQSHTHTLDLSMTYIYVCHGRVGGGGTWFVSHSKSSGRCHFVQQVLLLRSVTRHKTTSYSLYRNYVSVQHTLYLDLNVHVHPISKATTLCFGLPESTY